MLEIEIVKWGRWTNFRCLGLQVRGIQTTARRSNPAREAILLLMEELFLRKHLLIC